MEIKFAGKKYTQTKCVNNILEAYNKAKKPTVSWYKDANAFCEYLSNKYHIRFMKVVGIIAALSPLKSWKENKRIAEEFIKGNRTGHIQFFLDKAAWIMDEDMTMSGILDTLNGNKIKSFFMNIIYPENDDWVTIDRHTLSIAIGKKIKNKELRMLTDNQYEFFVNCYKKAARKVGLTPSELQSITWEYYRAQK